MQQRRPVDSASKMPARHCHGLTRTLPPGASDRNTASLSTRWRSAMMVASATSQAGRARSQSWIRVCRGRLRCWALPALAIATASLPPSQRPSTVAASLRVVTERCDTLGEGVSAVGRAVATNSRHLFPGSPPRAVHPRASNLLPRRLFSPTLSTAHLTQLRLWNDSAQRVASVSAHQDSCTCLALDVNAQAVWTAGEDGMLRCWVAAPRQAYDSDGGTGSLVIRQRGRPISAHDRRVTCIALGPPASEAARHLIASGGMDRSVRVHSTEVPGDPVLVCTCRGHSRWITRVQFTHDGVHLLSGSFDGTINMWNSTNGNHLRSFAVSPSNGLGPRAWMGPPPAPQAHTPGGELDAMITAIAVMPPPAELHQHLGERKCPLQHFFVAASMDGKIACWKAPPGRGLEPRLVGSATTGDAVNALTVLPPRRSGTNGWMAVVVAAHRSGSLTTWRTATDGVRHPSWWDDPDWCTFTPLAVLHRVHSDWASQLVIHPGFGGNSLVLSAGEDGTLACVRVAPPTCAWSRAAHGAFPDGFRAAARTFLLCLARMASDMSVPPQAVFPKLQQLSGTKRKRALSLTGTLPDSAQFASPLKGACTPLAVDLPAPASAGPRSRGTRGAGDILATPMPTPTHRRESPRLHGAPPAASARGNTPPAKASLQTRVAALSCGLSSIHRDGNGSPAAAMGAQAPGGGLLLHGATRDAIVDNVLAALANIMYSP